MRSRPSGADAPERARDDPLIVQVRLLPQVSPRPRPGMAGTGAACPRYTCGVVAHASEPDSPPMLYRVDGQDLTEVQATTITDESLYERDLEEWVARRPEVLGEHLLVIGRQVSLDEGRDRIDLLAVDRAGALVIIELKRDLVGGTADLQALRYAALVAGWGFEDLRRQAEGYWRTVGQEGTLAQRLDAFCDEGYELNADQRVILAGRDIKPRLGSMAQWLRAHRLDVTVVSIALFRDDDRVFLQPQTLIPVPTDERLAARVAIGSSDKPWLVDGQAWHLEQRCSARGREIVTCLVDLIGRAVPEADGPNWAQKQYVSWRRGPGIWLYLDTGSQQAVLVVPRLDLTPEEVAQQLGFEVFDADAELSEKLALGSYVRRLRDGVLRVAVKSPADVQGPRAEALARILQRSWRGLAPGATLSRAGDIEEALRTEVPESVGAPVEG